MKLLIDADGCPVVNYCVAIAVENSLECLIISDTAHYFEREGATTITVLKGADSVDFFLVNKIDPGDIVITQDYGLAAMALARRAKPISQDGMLYHKDNMDALLMARYEAQKIRKSGGRLKGNSKRTPEQNISFEKKLRELIKSVLDQEDS